MTTRTIEVSIADAKPGDLFSGEYTRTEGIKTVVTNIPLTTSIFGDQDLYPTGLSAHPYIRVKDDDCSYKWKNVRITREVPVKSRAERVFELPIGTIFKAGANGLIYTKVSATRFACFHYGNKIKPDFCDKDAYGLGDKDDDIIVIPDPKGDCA